MELERMRRVLAEGMGWTLHWPKGGYQRWVNNAYHEMVAYHDWHPDTDWQQCGLVIDMMRGKGWTWDVMAYTDGSARVILHHISGRQVSVTAYERRPEREARMLCAARALESEANDGQ